MKKVTEILSIPLITGIIIILGILKYVIFYKFFYIPITEYLQLSEILLLITDDIIYIVLFFGLPRLLGHFEELVNNEKDIVSNSSDKKINYNNRVKEFRNNRKIIIVFLSICLIVIIALAFKGNRFDKSLAFYGSICIVAIIFCICWEMSLLRQNVRYELRLYLYFSMLSICILLIVCFRAVTEAERVYSGEYKGTTIVTSDSIYVSDSFHFYIGRTSQYKFIYNKTEKSSTIFPNSEIKRMILKTKYAK